MKYRACIPSARFDPFEGRLFEDRPGSGSERVAGRAIARATLGKGRGGREEKGRKAEERGRNGYKRDKGRSCIPGVHRLPALG